MRIDTYSQNQMMLLPADLGEMIVPDHAVRFVSTVMDAFFAEDISDITAGRTSYNRSMMCKLVVWSYLNEVYSVRKIEDLAGTNVMYMWLTANTKPDFRTINLFRNREEDLLRCCIAALHYCASEGKVVRLMNERITRFAGNEEDDMAEAELFAKRILIKSRHADQDKRPKVHVGIFDPLRIMSIIPRSR